MDAERRRFLAGIGATVALAACGPSMVFEREADKTPENFSRGPELGDVVYASGKPYLLHLNNSLYIPDFPKFFDNIKGKDYGVGVYENLPDVFDKYPKRDNVVVEDIFNEFGGGQLRKGKSNGGEGLIFASGAWTDQGSPIPVVDFEHNPFGRVIESLIPLRWDKYAHDYLTYSRDPLKSFTWSDTMRSADEIIPYFIRLIETLKRRYPFERFNIIAHSLAGIYAFQAAMRHMDVINNLILISTPIKGLRSIANAAAAAIARLSWKDNAIKDLIELSKEENQKDVDRRAQIFTGKKRKITVIYHESDPIANADNAPIKGARLVVLKGGKGDPHGAGIREELALEGIKGTVGLNKAA